MEPLIPQDSGSEQPDPLLLKNFPGLDQKPAPIKTESSNSPEQKEEKPESQKPPNLFRRKK